MSIQDFLYEEIKEEEFNFDFYTLYIQHERDDPYYPSYNDVIGVYKYKENARCINVNININKRIQIFYN